MSIIRDGFQSADLDVPVVLPTLNLDFANSQELDPRITFSRGSIGTFVNKNGLIETAPANQPRFDYDPISGECRGLLIEESRVNYFWGTQTGNGGTVSDGTATGANGVTAKKFVPNLGNVSFPSLFNYNPYSIPVGSQVAGGTVDISFSGYFASVADGLYFPDIVIEFTTGITNNIYAELMPNLSNGTVWTKGGIGVNGVTELIAPQITLMPFGMYKITWSVRYTQGATIRDTVRFYIQCRRKGSTLGSNTGTYYADGKNGFQYSCVQYEVGAFPTSYIPTTISSVTRNPDNADMTGSNFTSWANSSVGTFVIRGRGGLESTQNGYGRFVGLGQGGSIGREGLSTRVGIWDTTNIFTVTNNSADVVNRNSNIAASFDGTLRRVVLNGVASSGISRRNINTIFTQIGLGKNGNSSTNYLNGTLSRVAYYPRQLNDAQMLYLTQ